MSRLEEHGAREKSRSRHYGGRDSDLPFEQISLRAAIEDVGVAFMLEQHAAPHLAAGTLIRVLEDWCPPFPGYFLYYPSRRQQPAALAAVIKTLRLQHEQAASHAAGRR